MAETDRDDLISIIEDEEPNEDIPAEMPLMPVRDVVIFTNMLLPLFVGRKKSVRSVEEAAARDNFLMLATQIDPSIENPKSDEIYKIGTVGRILRMLKLPDGRLKALVQGVAKARVTEYTKRRSWFQVRVEVIDEEEESSEKGVEIEALMRNVRDFSEKILALRGEMSSDVGAVLESIDDPGRLADLVASNLRLKIEEAQEVLELLDPVERLKKVNELLSREVELSAMQAKIQSDVKDEISKSQRDYFLREQMRAIHRELGEADEKLQEVEEYRKKIKRAKMPAAALEEAEKQLKRLEQMHPEAAESTIVRTYLDWMVELPWQKSSKDMLDIPNAKRVLDQDHYGLEKVKDRILEYLSVRKLNPATKGPILCFVGPPGVGKTSLGRAIARAMKRKFIRISLGGVRDEAEIRGHRRTYIGALPGRILQGLKQCGTNNPVFMMDEIDKIFSDFRGDPASALLEALDPEQNNEFSDHYINLPFDLSKVMFILTANMTDTIPSALYDRMEVLRIAGYTSEEKADIARQFLLPRQLRENGLKPKSLTISSGALHQIITEYTAEAGLRNLERELGAICRKVARKMAEDEKGPFSITRGNLSKYLGVPQYSPEMDQEESQVGLATGLAWTEIGGEVLYIETATIAGKGDMTITGQLGEVMQESVRTAFSYVRCSLKELGVAESFFDNLDTHIHVPAGAIPKDGPSAGIAIAASLISVATRKPLDNAVAMTGEITLRGRVLPIGGLREKAIGALRGGIEQIIIPEKNQKDLAEIPATIKRKIKFIPIRHMDEAIPVVFGEDLKALAAEKSKTKRTTARKRTRRQPSA